MNDHIFIGSIWMPYFQYTHIHFWDINKGKKKEKLHALFEGFYIKKYLNIQHLK